MYTVHTAHDTCSDIILIFPKSRDNKFKGQIRTFKIQEGKVIIDDLIVVTVDK